MDTCQRSAADHLRARPGSALPAALFLGVTMITTGCGGGTTASAPPPPTIAPAISMQPVTQSVPMGLTASYAVTATGSALQFQWRKNGAAIAGATSSNYTTPPTVFADTGASFSVTVSNPAGAIESNAASLIVTARAPMVGDLRFQQVDAPATVNGWGNYVGLATDLPARSAAYYSPSIGTPFYVGSNGNCVSIPRTDGTGCSFSYSEQPFAISASSPALLAGYAADFYDNLQSDLQSNAWPGFGNGTTPVTPVSSGSVITSLDLEPANVLFAVSWIQSTQRSGFLLAQNTVAPANLQAAAAQEGGGGRVITALSYDGGQVTYLSYGWQADTATIYETQVATASPASASAIAASLAAQGYIITATGRADDNGNVLFVGTRVQGDTMPRPFLAAPGSSTVQAMMQQGYAVVAVIFDPTQTDPYTWLGER